MHMSLDKRFTKPPKDNPHAVFLYGVECGVEQERERIIALLEATDLLKTIEQGVLVNYAEDAIALIKGENK